MRTKNKRVRVARKKPEHDLRFSFEPYAQILFCPEDTPGLEIRSGPCYELNTFGYHKYFRGVWVVYHVATRLPLQPFSSERGAKIKAKRLETGLDVMDTIDGSLRGRFDTDHDVPF